MSPTPTDSEIIFVHEVPQDTVLPQLAVVLNGTSMRKIFQTKLFDTCEAQVRFRIRACDILQLRYKRGKKCMVYYRLAIRDTHTRRDGEQILCVRAFEQGGSLARFNKAKARRLINPKFGRPLIHIPELEMVAWAFPNDRKLYTLPRFTNPAHLRDEIIPRVVVAHSGSEWGIATMTEELVHYVGEHTCTLRVDVGLCHRVTRERQEVVLYGKTYYNEEGAETYRVMQELWHSDAKRQGPLIMAKPLYYDPELKTLWQLGLHGSTLLEHDLHESDMPAIMERAASSVACLHKSTLSCTKTRSRDDWVAKLGEVTAMLVNVRPTCREALVPLIDRLVLQSCQFGSEHTATLHGDLHLKNFFFDSGAVTLIDLDNICSGPPLQDIGSFIASLYHRGILRGIAQPVVDKTAQSFIRAYAAMVPWPVPRAELAWYVAAALVVERAFRSVTRLKAGSLDIIDKLIELADAISLDKNTLTDDSVRAPKVAER